MSNSTQVPVRILTNPNPPLAPVDFKQLRDEVQGMSSKQKVNELHIQGLAAKVALANDRVDIMSKEVNYQREWGLWKHQFQRAFLK